MDNTDKFSNCMCELGSGLVLDVPLVSVDSDFDFDGGGGNSLKAATDHLNALRVVFSVKTQHHIRISSADCTINYYPGKGTVFLEGSPARFKGRGLDFLDKVLIKYGFVDRVKRR
jgi:hypothetical protein